jgi:uncharacterized protein (TIGR03382 family)
MHLVLAALLALPAYGEPDLDGLPNRQERLLHVFTNQVRQAPHAWPGWNTSLASNVPRPPVAHQPGLSAAARFHADDMKQNGCFAHESCDGTTFNVRMSRYFSGVGSSENIYTSLGDRSEFSAITGWMNSDGHRTNMLTAEWTLLGVGHAESGSQIWFVQDFGAMLRTTLPAIPAAAWETRGGMTVFHANFWDPGGREPREIKAVVDNTDVPLMHVVGPPGNATYSIAVETPDECTELFFVSVDADGDDARYPSEGALLFGPDCNSEYVGMPKPKPDRIVVDADEPGGCSAIHVSHGGLLPLLLLALLSRIKRRR